MVTTFRLIESTHRKFSTSLPFIYKMNLYQITGNDSNNTRACKKLLKKHQIKTT